jgi:hypothetical protein
MVRRPFYKEVPAEEYCKKGFEVKAEKSRNEQD